MILELENDCFLDVINSYKSDKQLMYVIITFSI